MRFRRESLVATLAELLDNRSLLLLVDDELLVHDLLDEARLVVELPEILVVHGEPVLLALRVHVHAELVELLQDLLDVLVLADLAAAVKGDEVGRSDRLRELESLNDTLTQEGLSRLVVDQLDLEVHVLVVVELLVVLDPGGPL